MSQMQNFCGLLKDCGFETTSQKDYHIQIFTKENLVVIVEEKQSKEKCKNSCCEQGTQNV